MASVVEERVLLARGFLLGTSGGNNAAPGSAATITIFDSTATGYTSWLSGLPFERVVLNVYSSHDSGASGVVFSSSFDRGTNFRTQATYTYLNANGATSYDYLLKGGHVKIAYTNSANVLTAWEMELFGCYDRNPGA
jgi:hypothetical protein